MKYELIPDGQFSPVWDLTHDLGLMPGAEGFEDFGTDEYTSSGPVLDGQRFNGWRALPREVFLPLMIPEYQMDAPVNLSWVQSYMRPGRMFTLRASSSFGVRTLRIRYVPTPVALDFSPELFDNVRGLRFVADDPWWVGPRVEHQFQTPEDALPFFAVGAGDRVFNLGSANTVDNITLSNPGEQDAWPVYRIDGPSTGFTISQSAFGAELTSAVEVPSGEYLILDTRPTAQTMRLSHDGGAYTTDETRQLANALFFRIPAGSSQPIYVTLNGAGSLLVSFDPVYQRAY